MGAVTSPLTATVPGFEGSRLEEGHTVAAAFPPGAVAALGIDAERLGKGAVGAATALLAIAPSVGIGGSPLGEGRAGAAAPPCTTGATPGVVLVSLRVLVGPALVGTVLVGSVLVLVGTVRGKGGPVLVGHVPRAFVRGSEPVVLGEPASRAGTGGSGEPWATLVRDAYVRRDPPGSILEGRARWRREAAVVLLRPRGGPRALLPFVVSFIEIRVQITVNSV